MDLLVTLADENYIDQAKQFFSSVYWNSGWKGDYMLLAHNIPESKLAWFRDKGILIKKCKPVVKGKLWESRFPTSALSKFYLFTTEFRKWQKVIYLDADIIVKSSLDPLLLYSGFSAGKNIGMRIYDEFLPESSYFFKNYNLNKYSFCAGVMVFDTKIIRDYDFNRLRNLCILFGKFTSFGDQGIFNLYFYNKFNFLPELYNVPINYYLGNIPNGIRHNIGKKRIFGAIYHFLSFPKPWEGDSQYNNEWLYNFRLADKIDLSNRPAASRKFETNSKIRYFLITKILPFYSLEDIINNIKLKIDRIAGLVGLNIKKLNPSLYHFLRRYLG